MSVTGRVGELHEYLEQLYRGQRNRNLYDTYAEVLATVTPTEVNGAIHLLIDNHDDMDRIEDAVARFIRAAGKGLDGLPIPEVPRGHFIELLLEEDRALKKHLGRLSAAFKVFSAESAGSAGTEEGSAAGTELQDLLRRTMDIGSHYRKIQYAVFPAMEEHTQAFNCTKLMWHLQDSVMAGLKELVMMLENPVTMDFAAFNRLFGKIYLRLGTLAYREERVLYPVILETVPEDRFTAMLRDLEEYGTSFDVAIPSSVPAETAGRSGTPKAAGGSSVPAESAELDLSVGRLLPKQIDLMLKNLPVDITYVDEHDRVRYYSQGKERIFPRSPGIIGRSVQNCHPPKSVHVVQKIVDDFKARRRDVADFWLEVEGRLIYIKYAPLFEGDIYRGVLEVSQDVTDLRRLEGEKRLLDEE